MKTFTRVCFFLAALTLSVAAVVCLMAPETASTGLMYASLGFMFSSLFVASVSILD